VQEPVRGVAGRIFRGRSPCKSRRIHSKCPRPLGGAVQVPQEHKPQEGQSPVSKGAVLRLEGRGIRGAKNSGKRPSQEFCPQRLKGQIIPCHVRREG